MEVRSKIMFSQVREDPKIDLFVAELVHQKLKDPLNTLIITSGGCTTLSLLCSPLVEKVTSYDANPAQNYLLELRIVLLNHLNSLEYLNVIQGIGSESAFNAMKSYLSDDCLQFWLKHIKEIKMGINQSGRFESLFRELSHKIRNCISDYKNIDFTNYETLKKWDRVFQEVFEREKLAQEYGREAVDYSMSKEFGDHFSEVFKTALIKYKYEDNYFIDQIFHDSYIRSYPQYIDHWVKGSEHKLTIKNGTFISQLDTISDNSFDLIGLSNITDWMSKEDMHSIFKILKNKIVKGGALLIRRLNGDHTLEDEVNKVFKTNYEMNAKLKKMDRSFFYSEVVLGFNE